ncbi:MAG: hypothetical protein HZA29_02930 [Candidatus Omnitrophica bacterium]|nr:hypothetical protein [Candidatus Omnitrophota bacterium]
MLVFLGSVLKQQDIHGDVGRERGHGGAVSSDNSRDVLLVDGADGPVVPPQARTPRPFFREGEGKPVFPPASAAQGKVTLKPTFDLSSPEDRPPADAAGDNLTKYEAGAYKPLRLPH